MYHVIINPASSSGKGMETWDRIKMILDEKMFSMRLMFWMHPERL